MHEKRTSVWVTFHLNFSMGDSYDGHLLDLDMEHKAIDAAWSPRLINFEGDEQAFEFAEGFSRPDWNYLYQWLQKTIQPSDQRQAWTELAIQWMRQLRCDLGGDYQVYQSRNFVLLTTLPEAQVDPLLAFVENTADFIEGQLKEAAGKDFLGPHVILLFAEADDYFQYVSYFYPDGTHPASTGCLIHKEYVHIAAPYYDAASIRHTLVHELAHNKVVHLPLPLWLNEGLAMTFERSRVGSMNPVIDHELRDRHMAFWTEATIQQFWAGTSFDKPGDSVELSYNLAEVLVNLLSTRSEGFIPFLLTAHFSDGGQNAALQSLGLNLGDLVATFLGEGNWRPNRKTIRDCWDNQTN